MKKNRDRLDELNVNLTDMTTRVVTPPDEDEGDTTCPKKDPGPGGIQRN